MPGPPQNHAFADPDKKTLYMVGRGNGYKIQMLTPGYKGPKMGRTPFRNPFYFP